ncbi:MAG TPA: hypothetical protein VFX12_04375 [Vicinamibacterales bacterium]|nr:hypothetical protein [Vicinamibacterales bacterium]
MRTNISDASGKDLSHAFLSVIEPEWQVATEIEGHDIEEACRRPELHPLARGLTIRGGANLRAPFRVPTATTIELAAGATRSEPALWVYLRHAFEIALWHRVTGAVRSATHEIAAAALAATTALRYLETLSIADREAALRSNPEWFRLLERLFSARRERQGEVRLAAGWLSHCAALLPLQGANPALAGDATLETDTAGLVQNLLPLAAPTERLLAWGGDGRLAIDPQSRLNKYGCGAAPRPRAVTFSSCTASSTSEIGYRSAESTRERLIADVLHGGRYEQACGNLIDQTRRDIADVLNLDVSSGMEIVLAASGTDCELFALYAALAGHTRDLVSIVVGPEEIGSGSLPAASGRHFDAVAPLTRAVAVGTPVTGLAVERLRIETLSLRDDGGRPVPLAEFDARVARLARSAVASGATALVHVVDSSKTGMRAPSLACVRALQHELGDRLVVLFDAAQMRIDVGRLSECAAAGAMIMISGSKFFTGSPFSGALIVPARYAAALDEVDDSPIGLGAYMSRLDVPARWRGLRAALPETPNVGLLLRWRTALIEMQAFRAVPDEECDVWYHAFRDAAAERLAAYGFDVVDAPVGERDLVAAGADWHGWPTIFTFFLATSGPDGNRVLLDYDEAQRVYLALNRDVSEVLPAQANPIERRIAATPCHLGQPVRLRAADGAVKGALRIAVGARYASRVAFDASLGADPEARVAAQRADLDLVLHKIAILLRYWPETALCALKDGTAIPAARDGG